MLFHVGSSISCTTTVPCLFWTEKVVIVPALSLLVRGATCWAQGIQDLQGIMWITEESNYEETIHKCILRAQTDEKKISGLKLQVHATSVCLGENKKYLTLQGTLGFSTWNWGSWCVISILNRYALTVIFLDSRTPGFKQQNPSTLSCTALSQTENSQAYNLCFIDGMKPMTLSVWSL